MGMAASQARLLCITARIHDVEYQAQSIQAAKVQLATQSDQVYEEYLAAMDACTLTVNALDMKTGTSSVIAANFNNLCSRNKVMASDGSNYAITNAEGRLVVEDVASFVLHGLKVLGPSPMVETTISPPYFPIGA